MGALLGLLFGVGALLAWRSGPRRGPARVRATPTRGQRTADLLAQAGIEAVTPTQFALLSVGAGFLAFVVVAAASRSPVIGLAFALIATAAPRALVKRRRDRRTTELRDVWPDVVDNIASAVRAGMSLPEALGEVGTRGPQALRLAFHRFAADYRASGRFGVCLDRLKADLADPVGDRVIEALRVARDVGGSDLGRLLRTLAAFLRDDARTRAELETRQGWTVAAARLALAAPWLMLALLSLNPQAARAYDSTAGVLVLLIGGGLSLAAYRLMTRIAKLPQEQRVLR
jgi:tight adherence protein B